MCLLILSDKTSTLPNGNPNGEFNMGLKVQKSKISSPKLSPTEITSPNPNIKSNSPSKATKQNQTSGIKENSRLFSKAEDNKGELNEKQ